MVTEIQPRATLSHVMISDVAAINFYSDRTLGPVPRDQDELPDVTRTGLVAYVDGLIYQHWFARSFPEECPDGNSVCGTDVDNLLADVRALIPGIRWPLNAQHLSDLEVLDLLEYTYAHIAKPKQESFHSFFKHWELTFNRKPAVRDYRGRVNQMLARGGANYEMDDEGRIQRRGSAPVRRLVDGLRPVTGDDDLDQMIHYATVLYTSKDPRQRQVALEKLWDGYERLKTITRVGNKKQSIQGLLKVIEPPELREAIEKEMHSLTDIGNKFRIRHAEVGTTPIPDAARDYLFTRMGDLLMYLLAENHWLSDQDE